MECLSVQLTGTPRKRHEPKGAAEIGRGCEDGRRTRMTKDAVISVVPANAASWKDLQAVLGTRGDPFRCQCQRCKMRPDEAWASFPVEERAQRLRTQTPCGHPESETTSGLVAYLDGEPVGWCAVEPRSAYPRLLRNCRVP